MEAYRLDIVQELFSLITTSTIETEAILAIGTIETITGTETITGIETEAGTEVTVAVEIGTTTATVADPRIGTTTEIITIAEIQDLQIIETTAIVGIRGQMKIEATQVTGEVEAQEAMLRVQHLRETEIAEQSLQVPHQEGVKAIGEKRFKLHDLLLKARIRAVQAEAPIMAEPVCQTEVKLTIQAEEEIISDNKNGDFRSPFLFRAKAD